MRELAGLRTFFGARTDRYALVEVADDIVRAKRDGKLAVGFHFQGTNSLERDLNMIEAVLPPRNSSDADGVQREECCW